MNISKKDLKGGMDMAKDAGESLYNIVDIISSKNIQDSKFDKTIQATIVSCLDPTIGKYKVKYQDGFWYAFSENIDVTYPNGTYVYILIPQGDFSKEKHIVGSVTKIGANYAHVEIQEDSVSYEYNLLEDLKDVEIGACSYQNSRTVLVDHTNKLKDLVDQLKSDNSLRLSALFRT